MNKSQVIETFNKHFIEFITDIEKVFPNDNDILTMRKSFNKSLMFSPKTFIRLFNEYFVKFYSNEIEAGDLSFFMDKDYTRDLQDVPNNPNAERIVSAIDRLRTPIKSMTADNQAKIMKYIQNLTKISTMYNMV